METLLKAVVTAAFIVFVSKVAERSTMVAALLVALPLATMMSVGLLYMNTGDAKLATRLATTTFALVWPGLVFFISLPLLQRAGLAFWPSFGLAVAFTIPGYIAMIALLRRLGFELGNA